MEKKSSIEYSVAFWWKAKSSSYEICLRGLPLCFFMAKSLSCSETQPSKFLKGLRYMILSITVKEIRFEMGI